MPASGMPVASTTTSMPGNAISASASAVTWVARVLRASPSEAAANCSAGQPAVASWLLARATLRSATRDDMQALGQPRLRQKHGAELAGADQADGDGRPAVSRSSRRAWRFMPRSYTGGAASPSPRSRGERVASPIGRAG